MNSDTLNEGSTRFISASAWAAAEPFGDMIGDVEIRSAFDHLEIAFRLLRCGAARQRRLFKALTRAQYGFQPQDEKYGNPSKDKKLEQGRIHQDLMSDTL